MRLGFAIAGAVIVLSMAGATVGIGMVQVHHIATVVRHYGHVEPFRRGTITPPPSGKPQTLLLVGSDRRYGDARGDAHSDTLMLVRLDPKQSATTVLSIPRDLRVTIPGHGIDKVNAAYGEGGLDLTTRTVKQLLSTPGRRFRVNHAIAINFKGFRDAVDIVNCVYIDVDRRYYHSNLGVPIGQRYAEIDVQPGYQRLCGQQALDYVRFRHLDNDIVRAARQQDFLRQASAQLSTSSLLRNLNPLVKAFAKATSSDSNLQTSRGILRLLRLAASSTGRPVRQVRFPHTFVQSAPRATVPTTESPLAATTAPIGLGDYVTATPDQIQRSVRAFMHPRPARHRTPHVKAKKRGGKRRARVSAASYGLVTALSAAKAIVSPGHRPPAFQAAVLRAGVAHAPRPLRREHGRGTLSAAVRDRRPWRPPPSGLPAGGRGGRDAGAVLRHRGHELAAPADPRRLTRAPADGGPQLSGVLRRPAYPPRRLAHLTRRLLGVEHPQPRPVQPRDARHRPLAHAHPRRLRHRSQLIRTSTRPGKRTSRSSRRSEISRCVPSARVRVTPASRSSRRW